MRITIDIYSGPKHNYNVTRSDVQKNIDAINRYLLGKQLSNDDTLLLDTRSVLETIQEELG